MSDVVYVSKSRIVRRQGPLRIAHLPGESQPVIYSVHGAIAEHYKVDPAKLTESHSSTIDYVISATRWLNGGHLRRCAGSAPQERNGLDNPIYSSTLLNSVMNAATKREFKDQLFEQFARIGKSLSNGRRLEILELLAQGPRTVEELSRESGLSIANTSQHLQVLRRCNLVTVKREGLYASYKLASEDVLQIYISMRRLGERHLSDIQRLVETYLSSRDGLEAISCHELVRRLKEKNVFMLDVRPREEYEAGHIAGARSIPISELKARLKEIPQKQEIVAYCRGPYCIFADEAVSILVSRDYRAVRLREGFPEWKTLRLPIEVGARVAIASWRGLK